MTLELVTADLATLLREGTHLSHTKAENTAFMKCFLKGIVHREPFRKLLVNLYLVYAALETELKRHSDHPVLGPLNLPELYRQAALAEDLDFYYGSDWPSPLTPVPSGRLYAARIHQVARTSPSLLVAHAYVRYMGDLSGGQSLRVIARSALELPPHAGTRLHEFDQLPTPEARRAFKQRYRDILNHLPLDEDTKQALVAEANLAFDLNQGVMQDLEPDLRQAIGPEILDLLTRQDRPGSTMPAAGPAIALMGGE